MRSIKYITTLIFLILSFPFFANAMVDSDEWSYMFHLEYSQGALKPSGAVKFPYSPIPVEFSSQYQSNETDFYGIIFNVKNKEEARFGFMMPTTTVVSSGISTLEVLAPKFADADHVSFYTRTNKHLFDISVKDSSFCNDNGRCDSTYGEDFKNCPADCTAPIATPQPPPSGGVSPEPDTSTYTTPPEQQGQAATSSDVSYVTTGTSQQIPTGQGRDTKTIISFVGGILILVLAFVFYRSRKAGM